MNPQKGPLIWSAKNLAARMPPIQQPSLSAAVLRKYQSNVPLHRPPAAGKHLPEEPFQITPVDVQQALAAAQQGNTFEVPGGEGDFTVRLTLTVHEAIQQSGLSPEETQRVLDRLARELGRQELVAQLPHVPQLPELKVYRTVIGRPGMAFVFRFVLTVAPNTSAVVVLNCLSRRERTA